MRPALCLLELDSIAVGIRVGDAMAKRAPLGTLRTGTVHPGKYLVLAAGEVAAVEEARLEGRLQAADSLRGEIFLPDAHPALAAALSEGPERGDDEALGIVETSTVAAVVGAADAGLKGADVRLVELRLADGLGGKGYLLFAGTVAEVEAAVELACSSLAEPGDLVAAEIIARLDSSMWHNLTADPLFRHRVRSEVASVPKAEGKQ